MSVITRRTPYLQVTGPNDEDMLKTWGSHLIGCSEMGLTDRSDEAGRHPEPHRPSSTAALQMIGAPHR